MVWIYLALWAYFLNAISFIIDKYLLASPIPRPFVYAFWVAALSGVAVVLIPFGVSWITPGMFLVALLSGITFFLGLIFFYKSLKQGDVSVGAAKTGTFTVLFSYIFSPLILGPGSVHPDLFASLFLLIGIAILARVGKSILPYSIASGAFFGLSLIILKYVFGQTDFINGIFWTRMGFVLSAIIPLAIPELRQQVTASFKTTPRSRTIFIFNKIVAGCGFLSLYYAIQLGNVAVVNSLLGLQFVFVFLLAVLLRKAIPAVAENFTRSVVWNKIVGIGFITAGFLKVLIG